MSYLGQGLGLGREERFTATATAGQTTVTVGDDGRSISYTPNYVDVYLNGSKQVNGSDVTVSSGTSIVFASALTAGDVVDVVAPGYFQPADTVSRSLGGTFLGAVNFPSGGLNVGSGQLRVDSSGRVLKSSQPSFRAGRSTTWGLTGGVTVPFDTAITNVGGHYNTTNYRFTAPVAGTYMFYIHTYTSVTSGAVRAIHMKWRVNGTEIDNTHGGYSPDGGYAFHPPVKGVLIIPLAAGDWVDTFITGGNWGTASFESPSYWGGYLLG